MGYDWGKNAENDRAERIPAGQAEIEIVKVVTGSKANGPFQNANGDPQIMLIFGDNQDRETPQMYTLSDKAAWKLAQLLEAMGCDLKRMTADGITPDRFADQQFAEAQLLRRSRFRADISYNDKGYANVQPLRREPQADGASQGAVEEIPI